MDISGQYRIDLPREEVWRALMDPSVLRRCLPGCESLEETRADEYRAKVALVIGPVKAVFDTEIKVTDQKPPESYRLSGQGKGGALGFGQGNADIALTADGAATILKYTAGFQVGGRLAQLGSRLVLGSTRMLLDKFFENLSHVLGTAQAEEAGAGKGRGARLTLWLSAAVLLIAVLMLLFMLPGNAS